MKLLGMVLSLGCVAASLCGTPGRAVAADACLQVPVGCRVTSTFGTRYNPITRNFSSEFHRGVDFGCPVGTQDLAAAGGQVGVAGFSESAGNWVVISAPGGTVYKYMHHAKLLVSQGSMVNTGQLLGWTGNTGRSTGPHMHFQVEVGRNAVDPYTRFCTPPPLKEGVLQGADAPEGDTLDSSSQAGAPGAAGPAMGMDGSLDQIVADLVASRALNPDYAQQLATLSVPRLYAELAYMQSIRLKIRQERNLHKERMLATEAMVEILMTERTLTPQLNAQRRAAQQAATGRP